MSQYGVTALVAAARRGHKDTVELLLNRGADLEAKDDVIVAAVCVCCATGRAGRHGRVGVGGNGGDASGRRAAVAGWRWKRRWREAMSAGERRCDKVRCRAGLRRCS